METLKHYLQIFNELDAEYEKYFNDYESVSKLQRLLDKDPNEIVKEFSDMVENNLRVDFNTKKFFRSVLDLKAPLFLMELEECLDLQDKDGSV